MPSVGWSVVKLATLLWSSGNIAMNDDESHFTNDGCDESRFTNYGCDESRFTNYGCDESRFTNEVIFHGSG
jgi:hypothetical protein